MSCGYDGEHCQEEYLAGEVKRLEEQVSNLSDIVLQRGNLSEVNYVRSLRFKKPLSSRYWRSRDIERMGG
jgi:hypothetical protein